MGIRTFFGNSTTTGVRLHCIFFFTHDYKRMLSIVSASAISYTVGIVGIRGGLGRELASQSLARDWRVVGFVRGDVDSSVYEPFRNGWLRDGGAVNPIESENLKLSLIDPTVKCDALIFAMSGPPFEEDISWTVVDAMCATGPSCVVLVSAYGVGDGIAKANAGVQIMRNWYLKSAYESKRKQEATVEGLDASTDYLIVRPKMLSYGNTPYNSVATPREGLARDILDFCAHRTFRHNQEVEARMRVSQHDHSLSLMGDDGLYFRRTLDGDA